MNKIMLIGFAVLGLMSVTAPADATHRHGRRHIEAPTRQQWAGPGMNVEEVVPHTGAARAGIRPGDVIVAVNGSAVSGSDDINSQVAASGGRALTVEIVRGGRRLRVMVSPTLLNTRNLYGDIEQHRVLGVAHTEEKWILFPCNLDPDCE